MQTLFDVQPETSHRTTVSPHVFRQVQKTSQQGPPGGDGPGPKIPFRLYAYFPSSKRWIEATLRGAEILALKGHEIAWACRTPRTEAAPLEPGNTDRWHRFLIAVIEEPWFGRKLSSYTHN